eukprot:scpid106018/ scgid2865/ 
MQITLVCGIVIPIIFLFLLLSYAQIFVSPCGFSAEGNSASCNSYPGPCFNGGDCGRVYIAGREEYICKCRNIFYEGDYCETGTFPAYSLELEDLQTKVASLKTALDLQKDKTKLLGTGCNLRTVGYKYQSQHNLFQEKDVGQVASMTFTKKRNDTVL